MAENKTIIDEARDEIKDPELRYQDEVPVFAERKRWLFSVCLGHLRNIF